MGLKWRIVEDSGALSAFKGGVVIPKHQTLLSPNCPNTISKHYIGLFGYGLYRQTPCLSNTIAQKMGIIYPNTVFVKSVFAKFCQKSGKMFGYRNIFK
jgi:hypothetical protein